MINYSQSAPTKMGSKGRPAWPSVCASTYQSIDHSMGPPPTASLHIQISPHQKWPQTGAGSLAWTVARLMVS